MTPDLNKQLDELACLIKLRQFDEAMLHLKKRADKEHDERVRRAMMPSDSEEWADVRCALDVDSKTTKEA